VVRRAVDTFTGQVVAPYQAAVLRIGFGSVWALYLLREWPNRRVLYGDQAPWSSALAGQLLARNHAFTVLAWSPARPWFELVYHLAIVSAVLFALGWRTRLTGPLFAVTVLSLQNRDVLIGDGGDNVLHLMALYLLLTRCAEVWSLDARRPRRYGPYREPRAVREALTTMLHNCGMLVIAAQVVLIYATAGWYKTQGAHWLAGTAVKYPLHIGYFTPWPALSGLLGSSVLLVSLATYATVAIQLAFPFTLFTRRLKNLLLALMVAEHLTIAVLLGIPFFSLAMIVCDAVFLPTALLRVRGRAPRSGARPPVGVSRGVPR
jgi:hypothetical protein